MEQITRTNGVYHYNGKDYLSVESVYEAFRSDYHTSLGKAVHNRLDRVGRRKERVHGFGFVFDDASRPVPEVYGRKFSCRFMGLVGICYVRNIGAWDYEDIPDDEFERWFDRVFSRGSGLLRTLGVNKKVGRTSKRLKTRYR